MRAAALPFCVGVVMFSRTYRALVVVNWCRVTGAVLPVTVATGVHADASRLTWRSKSRVLTSAASPPAAAWLRTAELTGWELPRSTWSQRGAVDDHHLSVRPPLTLPLTAFSGPS